MEIGVIGEAIGGAQDRIAEPLGSRRIVPGDIAGDVEQTPARFGAPDEIHFVACRCLSMIACASAIT